MSENICDKCQKDFKYYSLLQRHLSNKKPCTIKIPIVSKTDTSNTVKKDIVSPATGCKDNIDLNTKVINMFEKLISNVSTNPQEKYNLVTKTFNKFIETINRSSNNMENNTVNDNKYCCEECNINFSCRQSLYKHKKFNRCKINSDNNVTQESASGLNLNDIMNANIVVNTTNNDNSNNVINNTNNTVNNNITININPFKCESLDHISLEDFKNIYKTTNNIDNKLCYFIYTKHKNNIYFFKNNVKENLVSFLNYKMEIQKMTEDQFIREIKDNINESKFELFYIFKNNLSIEELIKYMKNMIIYHNNIFNNKEMEKSFNDNIRIILDDAFRDKDTKNIVKHISKELSKNQTYKEQLKNNNKEIISKKILGKKEYYTKPSTNNNDDKYLYKIRQQLNSQINNDNNNNNN
jgi:hypothetical protein